jgi:hypothetical protein
MWSLPDFSARFKLSAHCSLLLKPKKNLHSIRCEGLGCCLALVRGSPKQLLHGCAAIAGQLLPQLRISSLAMNDFAQEVSGGIPPISKSLNGITFIEQLFLDFDGCGRHPRRALNEVRGSESERKESSVKDHYAAFLLDGSVLRVRCSP